MGVQSGFFLSAGSFCDDSGGSGVTYCNGGSTRSCLPWSFLRRPDGWREEEKYPESAPDAHGRSRVLAQKRTAETCVERHRSGLAAEAFICLRRA